MPSDAPAMLSVAQAAEILGVHYMTAYRYVRTGVLDAHQEGVSGRCSPGALDRFRSVRAMLVDGPGPRPTSPGSPKRLARRAVAVADRLVAGDEPAPGASSRTCRRRWHPRDVYLEVIGQALRIIGDRWEAGTLSIGDEHRASVVAMRIVGRLGARRGRPGRSHGSVVLAAAPGDRHGIPTAILADLLRAEGLAGHRPGRRHPRRSDRRCGHGRGPPAGGRGLCHHAPRPLRQAQAPRGASPGARAGRPSYPARRRGHRVTGRRRAVRRRPLVHERAGCTRLVLGPGSVTPHAPPEVLIVFLALREMRRAMVRFGLLMASIGLLVFLILFQQTLQNGLITSFVGGDREPVGAGARLQRRRPAQPAGQRHHPRPLEQQIRSVDGVGDAGAIGQGTVSVRSTAAASLTPPSSATTTRSSVRPTDLVQGRRPSPGAAPRPSARRSASTSATRSRSSPAGTTRAVTVVGLARRHRAPGLAHAVHAPTPPTSRGRWPPTRTPPGRCPRASRVEPAPGVSAEQVVTRINDAVPDADALTRARRRRRDARASPRSASRSR